MKAWNSNRCENLPIFHRGPVDFLLKSMMYAKKVIQRAPIKTAAISSPNLIVENSMVNPSKVLVITAGDHLDNIIMLQGDYGMARIL